MTDKEVAAEEREVVDVSGGCQVLLRDPDVVDAVDVLHRSKETQFAFDAVLDRDASQADVYNAAAGHIVHQVACLKVAEVFHVDDRGCCCWQVFAGANCTVFAYGATGSGKTYTMAGTATVVGLSVKFKTVRAQARRSNLV